ncbi:MAG: hypothetical protein R8G66_01760 [Cytophagales bacterium]|nr:hypothetical protein [Cytophagales bacterium]
MSALVILDVFIGLVFLYLLYSLLATVIVEFIASVFGLRARNLEWTIARMLSDQNYNPYAILNKLLLTLNGIGRLFYRNRESLLKAFYELPEIKYSSEGGLFNKPSYLSKEVFSRSLTEALKNQGKAEAGVASQDQDKIEAALLKLKEEAKDTHVQLTMLWNEASKDITKFRSLIEEWFEQMNNRASGWYKRKVQLMLLFIGMFIAYWANLDSIELANRLAKDTDARDQLVAMALKRATGSTDTAAINKAYVAAQDSLTSDINNAHKMLGSGWPEDMDSFCKWCHIKKANRGLGYFLTALAISLGAPFWFDLLNKLVRLRSSIPQPISNQQGSGNTSSPSSPRSSSTGNDVIPARRRNG